MCNKLMASYTIIITVDLNYIVIQILIIYYNLNKTIIKLLLVSYTCFNIFTNCKKNLYVTIHQIDFLSKFFMWIK